MARPGSSQHTSAGRTDAPPARPKPLDRLEGKGTELPDGAAVCGARRQPDCLAPELLNRERRPVHVVIGSGPGAAADRGAVEARSGGFNIGIPRKR